jgi:hypothetical protein
MGTHKAPLDDTPTSWLSLSVSGMDNVADVTPEIYGDYTSREAKTIGCCRSVYLVLC